MVYSYNFQIKYEKFIQMKTNNKNFKLIIAATLVGLSTFAFAGFARASDITPENVLYLLNKERVYYGVEPLHLDPDLTQAATLKSRDMIGRDYFEHYNFGLTPWDFIRNQNYNFLYAGENLAMDFQTSEGMVNAWLNSPTHRQNILSSDFNDTGIGIVKGAYTEDGKVHETVMVTDMFGRKKPAIVEVLNNIAKNISYFFSR